MLQEQIIEDENNESLTEMIQREIESQVLSGQLEPGSRLNEKQLAEKLGVSRAPVREVTRALQQMGLVEIIRNRGVFLRSVNLKDVVAIFDIRVALARLAATEAARRMTPCSVKQLSDLIDRMHAAPSAEEYLPLNLEFHHQIFEASDNLRLSQLDASLSKELRLYRLRGLRSSGSMKTSNEEHRAIFAALVDRNPEFAGRLFEQHVLAGRDRFLDTIDRPEPTPSRGRGRPRKIRL